MKPIDNDIMRGLFSGIHDEPLPADFNEKVMARIRRESVVREKRKKILGIFGYASGVVAMIAACVFTIYYTGISFEMPDIKLPSWSFPKPDYSIFTSQSFKLSAYIGILALFLIIIDSVIRHHIEKTGRK